MPATLVPSSTFSRAELAALFTAGYEGYVTPVQVDEAAFSTMVELWDVDLDASRVALDAGEAVGLVDLALREEEAWIGGVGVLASRRGEGLGLLLMRAAHEQAAARGAKRVWLEVLVENDPALRLYERLGYRRVRELEVWSLDGGLGSREALLPPLAPAEALGREARPPWQRADATIAHLDGVEALGGGDAVLAYRRTAGVASLLQCAAPDAAAARRLLEALPAGTTGARWLNGPAGHPLNDALASLGAELVHRQHELVLEL